MGGRDWFGDFRVGRSCAHAKHISLADRTFPSRPRPPVLSVDRLRVLHLPFCFALHAISSNRVIGHDYVLASSSKAIVKIRLSLRDDLDMLVHGSTCSPDIAIQMATQDLDLFTSLLDLLSQRSRVGFFEPKMSLYRIITLTSFKLL